MNEQILMAHGFQVVEWHHASLPDRFWAKTTRIPNGCWKSHEEQPANIRDLAVMRLLRVNPKEALAITPTCGDWRCVNPAHTCVTMRTPLSQKEQ